MGLALLLTFENSNAGNKKGNLTSDDVIATYVNAVANGNLKDLSAIIDDDARFSTKLRQNFFVQSKEDVMNELAFFENVKQNCKVTQSVVGNMPTQLIVKVDFDYGDFTKANYVTVSETNNGWLITNVSSVFVQ